MPRPGADIRIVDSAPVGGGAVLDPGQAFFVGATERGPTDRAVPVIDHGDYQDKFGVRAGFTLLYDAVRAYFEEGGSVLYISRVVGAGGAAATIAYGVHNVKATSPGTWGNSLTVETQANTGLEGGNIVIVKLGGVEQERSYPVATMGALVTWASERSNLVTFTQTPGNETLPTPGTVTLAAGTAGTPGSGTTDLVTALARFTVSLGPGQVAAPGYTDNPSHQAIAAHCDTNKRTGLLDAADTANTATLASAATQLTGKTGARLCSLWAPWVIWPAETPPATVTIPYSALQAALISRADKRQNPNQPAAGVNGVSRMALGLSQSYSDTDRQQLNNLGVDLGKVKYGQVRTYGYRTVAGPADKNWLWFGNSRVLTLIAHEADAIAENYVLRQIDGRDHLFMELEVDLRGMLSRHYDAGALFGERPEDAFAVDWQSVNTIQTRAAGEVHAVLRVKTSPSAEWVQIDVVKVPLDQAIVAANPVSASAIPVAG